MNKARKLSLALGAIAVVGTVAFVLGNYLTPGGLFQSALITPVDKGIPVGTGFTSETGFNFTFNPDLNVDDGSFYINATLAPFLGGASNVADKAASNKFPDGWTNNPDAYYAFGIQPGSENWPKNELRTDPVTSKTRLLMDARDKTVQSSMRQISQVPANKIKVGDRFVLRAWVSSANNADQEAEVKLTVGHNNCLYCWAQNHVELEETSSDYLKVYTGNAQMITTPVLTITKPEVMAWDQAQGRVILDPTKFPAGTSSLGGTEGNLFSQIAVKPGHAVYVERIEVVKVDAEDSKILANSTFSSPNGGAYVRTIQPNLPQGQAPYLPSGWNSATLNMGVLGCGGAGNTVVNTGNGIQINSGSVDGCIYQYKVQGDWDKSSKKYASSVKVGDEYVAKATIQGVNEDAYIALSASHFTEEDITNLKNYDFDHVKIWGTAKKDTPTVFTTYPMKVTSEDASGLHVLGSSVIVYGPASSALVKSVEMIKCTKDTNGNYVETECKPNSESKRLPNPDMKWDKGIPHSNATSPNTIPGDSVPDQWRMSCSSGAGGYNTSTANAFVITANGAKVAMPDGASYCDIYQVVDVPMVKGDTYVGVTKMKGDEALIKSMGTYTWLVHNAKWSSPQFLYPQISVYGNKTAPRDAGNGVWESITTRLKVDNPNHQPGEAGYWNFRREFVLRVTRTVPLETKQPEIEILSTDVIPCSSIDTSSEEFKNYCVQDLLPKGNRLTTNAGLVDNVGLLSGANSLDSIPDGWTVLKFVKDRMKYFAATTALPQVVQLVNEDVNLNGGHMALSQTVAVNAIEGKKFVGVAQMRSSDENSAPSVLRISRGNDVEFAGDIQSVSSKLSSRISGEFPIYVTPLLAAKKTVAEAGDKMQVRLFPNENYGIDVQNLRLLQVDDADTETVRGKVQYKPVHNGSFEFDNGMEYPVLTEATANNALPDGWSKSGCTPDSAMVSDQKVSGEKSLKLMQDGKQLCMFQQPSTSPITKDDLYVLSAKVKNMGTRDGVFQMRWVHNFYGAEFSEELAFSNHIIPKNSDWMTVRSASKIRIQQEDLLGDGISMTEIFNITNVDGVQVPLYVDDVKLTNCTINSSAEECLATPDANLAPTDQQLLYNTSFVGDAGALPLTDGDKGLRMDNTALNNFPDGWFHEGWSGPSGSTTYEYVTIKDAIASGLSTTKYWKFDGSKVPLTEAPLVALMQHRNISPAKGEKFRAVAYVRSANPNNAPVNVGLNVEHNPFGGANAENSSGTLTVGGEEMRIETDILEIKKDNLTKEQLNGSGNLGVSLYIPRGSALYIKSIQLYKVPNDFTAIVVNKNLRTDNGSLYYFGENSANRLAGDNKPDGWRSLCTDAITGKDYTNLAHYLASGVKYYYHPDIYALAFASEIGAGKVYATADEHYNGKGKFEGYLEKPAYAEAQNTLAPGYNADAYLLAFPDVAVNVGPGKMFATGIQHYLPYGKSETRLERQVYIDAQTALGSFDKALFKHDMGYNECQIDQVNNTSTKIGDEYVAYVKVKNVSTTEGELRVLIGHNWWADSSVEREANVYSSWQKIAPGADAIIKTGKLKILYPDASTGSITDFYKLGTSVMSKTPGRAYKVDEVSIINCTKEPTNDMCLPTPDSNLLGKGKQVLVNTSFSADNGAVPKEGLGTKMDGIPGNGIPDGWLGTTEVVTMTEFGRSNVFPVVKLDGGTGKSDFRQIVSYPTKGKKFQAVVQVRTANPGNTPANFTIQLANNPYVGAPKQEMKSTSFTTTGETFTTFKTDILSVTQDPNAKGQSGGYDNLFFNIFPTAGNQIYVQKAELFEVADEINVVAQNTSFENDTAEYYSQIIGGNMNAGDKLPDGWTFTGNAATVSSLDTTQVKSGNSSLKVSTTDTVRSATFYQALSTNTNVGDEYVLAADVYAASPTQFGLMLTHNGTQSKDLQSAPGTIQMTASGSLWTKVISQKMKIAFEDVANAETLRSTVRVMSPNRTIFIDNVQLINCTQTPTVSECTTQIHQNPILINGEFEVDAGITDLAGSADATPNNKVPDTWRSNCGAGASISSMAGKSGTGILLQTGSADGCLFQYSNFVPVKDHLYVATAEVKSANANQYTASLRLLQNPNAVLSSEKAMTDTVGQTWKTLVTEPMKIQHEVLLPKDMPYGILERFGIVLSVKEGNARIVADNISIINCTLNPNNPACVQALASLTAEKSSTMGDSLAVKGQTYQRIGSVTLTGASNAATLTSMKFTYPKEIAGLTNFKLTSTGTTMLTGQTGSGNVLFTFGSGVQIGKNTNRIFDVYADVATTATAPNNKVQLSLAKDDLLYKDTLTEKALTAPSTALSLQQVELKTTLPVATGSVTLTKNTELADQVALKDGLMKKIGSFTLLATGETFRMETITVNLSGIQGVSNLYLTGSGQTLGNTISEPTLTNTIGLANQQVYLTKDKAYQVDIFAKVAETSTLTGLQVSLEAQGIRVKNDAGATLLLPSTTLMLQSTQLNELVKSAPTTASISATTVPTQAVISYGGGGGSLLPSSTIGQDKAKADAKNAQASLVCPPNCESYKALRDVPESHFASNAVKYLSIRGILKGYNDNTFRLNNPINRAEFAKVVTNGFILKSEKTAALPFKDIKSSDWFYSVVKTVYASGLVKGYPTGEFRPGKDIQRDEAVKIMALADAMYKMKVKEPTLTQEQLIVKAEALINEEWNAWKSANPRFTYVQFKDVGVNTWYAKYVLYALDKGYISGRTIKGEKIFAPSDRITRGEASVLIARIIDANKILFPVEKNNEGTFTVVFPQ